MTQPRYPELETQSEPEPIVGNCPECDAPIGDGVPGCVHWPADPAPVRPGLMEASGGEPDRYVAMEAEMEAGLAAPSELARELVARAAGRDPDPDVRNSPVEEDVRTTPLPGEPEPHSDPKPEEEEEEEEPEMRMLADLSNWPNVTGVLFTDPRDPGIPADAWPSPGYIDTGPTEGGVGSE